MTTSSASMVGVAITVLAMMASLQGFFAYDPSPLQDFCIADSKSSGVIS